MKPHTILIITAALVLLLICGTASAANVTSCTVDTCNIYAGSNEFSIAPNAQIDSSSTASGIDSENMFLRIAEFSMADIPGSQQKKFSAILQGSTITLTDAGKVTIPDSYTLDFGDGTPALRGNPHTPDVYHTYKFQNTYTASLTAKNQLSAEESESLTFKTTYNGYSTYASEWPAVLALFALIPLIFVAGFLIHILRGGGDISQIIPVAIAVMVAVILLMFIVFIGGYMDSITAGFFT
ncbi:MAG: PKD domain-containing protein [Methanocorpusculum sp.]|nr:PKD domain-containing protein [Methanocorpusculum sp.]